MSELEDKLNAVLADPEAMGKIMALAQSLSGGEAGQAEEQGGDYVPVEEAPQPPPEGVGDLARLLGQADPKMMQMGMRLMREYSRSDDRNTALLNALRPFVKEERFAKVDRAIRIAKLSRVVRVLLESLRGREGGGDV